MSLPHNIVATRCTFDINDYRLNVLFVNNKCHRVVNFGIFVKMECIVLSELYNTIQRLCVKNDLSPSALCTKLGLSKSTLSNLKNGRVETLSGTTVLKIANYFGVTVNDIMAGVTTTSAPEIVPMPVVHRLSDEENALLDLFRQMNYTGRKKFLEMAEDMVELPKYRKEQI